MAWVTGLPGSRLGCGTLGFGSKRSRWILNGIGQEDGELEEWRARRMATRDL